MDVNEFLGWLTDGLDDNEKAVVTKAVQRDVVKAKAAGLKAQSEFDAIITERQKLQAELDGDQAAGKLGTRAYREWYEKNFPSIIANDKAIKDFETKHGTGSFAKAAAGELPTVTPPVTSGVPITEAQIQALIDARVAAGASPKMAEADIQRMVDARIQGAYAPKWSDLLTDTGTIVQKHMYAKRTNLIDFKKVSSLATEKNISIEAAYDEWDKPERDKMDAEARANEIKAAVATERTKWDEERKQQNATNMFPGGADATPSALSVHKGAEGFDKNSMIRDLARGWNSAGGTDTTQ